MAHFYGVMQGNRGKVSRIGTKLSGFTADIRGWNIGVRVKLVHLAGEDMITIYRTGGSNSNEAGVLIAQYGIKTGDNQ